MAPRDGFFGTMLMTPPMAPSPWMTEAGPRSTSMRSMDQVSNGKVTPTPPYWRRPSYRRITDAPSVKPRLDSALRPLPGCGIALIAPARLIASLRLLSPRCSSWSRSMTVSAAGVCSTLRPTAEPALGTADSSPWRVSTTRTVSRVVGSAASARAGAVYRAKAHSAGSVAQRRATTFGFVFMFPRHAMPPLQRGQQKESRTRMHRAIPGGFNQLDNAGRCPAASRESVAPGHARRLSRARLSQRTPAAGHARPGFRAAARAAL